MNIEARLTARAQKSRLALIDCDIHPKISIEEMREELRRYTDYTDHFSITQANNPKLSFVVVPNGEAQPNLGNLERWYERDAGEKVGIFTIYRVKLRDATTQ